ncbi:hypothetical protein KIN20_023978 [Parelaphostrongylus tenuis]|uniref:SCP domain-containing protein n=1 Tax=Parelaphostrongylus tenuis TaxID=148309 RepID=A0AAD5N737_PARTN|nr:hypothetical protein KIN20_023978 [Parelaphostrongylus tenuis]
MSLDSVSSRYEPPFGCPQQYTLNDQNRTEALNLINQIRSSVALGTFQGQTFLPPASDMNKLQWNCDLEKIAQDIVANCPPQTPQSPLAFGKNYRFFGPVSSTFDRRFPVQSAILLWADISGVAWPAGNVYDGKPALFEFSNMILANTLSVGCSGVMCTGTSAAACIFSSPLNEVGTPGPYTGVSKVSASSSLVARGLAKNGEYVNENAAPASRMDLMEYDCLAEQYALNHVLLCNKQQSPPLARAGYSENIHVLATTATDVLGAIQNAIASFTNELGTNGIPSHMVLAPEVVQRTQRNVTRVTKIYEIDSSTFEPTDD